MPKKYKTNKAAKNGGRGTLVKAQPFAYRIKKYLYCLVYSKRQTYSYMPFDSIVYVVITVKLFLSGRRVVSNHDFLSHYHVSCGKSISFYINMKELFILFMKPLRKILDV